MKILIVWRDVPSKSHPPLARPFYFVKYNKSHEIVLASLSTGKFLHEDLLYERCNKMDVLKIPKIENKVLKGLYSLKNKFTYQNVFFSKDFNIFRIYFPAMRKKVLNLLHSDKFDIVYADYMMYPYLYNMDIKMPVILEFFSPTLYALRNLFSYERSLPRKVELLMKYYSFRIFEVHRYREFDAGIYVTKAHQEHAKPFLPKKSFIIPPGVDLEFFKPYPGLPNSSTLVFTGHMSYLVNVYSILHFYNRIYPSIKKEVDNVKLYITGRYPTSEIKKLALRDSSIMVTGEMRDVRPCISKAQVVIAPIIVDDGGIKNKIMEAMAMGKPVVSTSLGAQGIGTTHGENIIISDDVQDFAEQVINLLQDESLRRRIGYNARKFVEKNYSWERQTDLLNKAMEEVANKE